MELLLYTRLQGNQIKKKKKKGKRSKHKTCGRVGMGLPGGMGMGPMCDKRHSDVYGFFC